MILAAKSNLWWIAVGLGILLLVASKGSYALAAAGVGILAAVAVFLLGSSDLTFYVMAGGLGLVLLLLAKKDSDQPSGYYPPSM